MRSLEELETLAEPHWAERPVWKGFDIGPGWYDLVYDLITDLIEIDDTFEIMQIKEKFGSLRFYTDYRGLTSETPLLQRIRHAENLSVIVCDICGAPGVNRKKDNWLATRCDEHKDR
jgi:hypothetical protein